MQWWVLRLPRPIAAIATAGGILDMLANLLYLLAARQGPLTLAVTLAALYPASTVMLAWTVLHERLTARQWAGRGTGARGDCADRAGVTLPRRVKEQA